MKLKRRKNIKALSKECASNVWEKYDRGVTMKNAFNEELAKLVPHTSQNKAWNLLTRNMEDILKRRINHAHPTEEPPTVQRRSNGRQVRPLY